MKSHVKDRAVFFDFSLPCLFLLAQVRIIAEPAGLVRGDGTLEPVYNAFDMAELAAEKGATAIVLQVSSRKEMNEMSDDLAARLTVIYYTDPRDALLKVLGE